MLQDSVFHCVLSASVTRPTVFRLSKRQNYTEHNLYDFDVDYRYSLVFLLIRKRSLIEHGLTSPPTQYRLSGTQFYRSKDPTNSIKVLKEKRYKGNPRKSKQPYSVSQKNPHRVF